MRKRRTPERPETTVELVGRIAADLPEYARTKFAAVLAHSSRPVLRSRLRVVRYRDPARERPVTARANIDVNGRLLQVESTATTPREAIDLLVDRLARRLERAALHWEARRGRTVRGVPRRGRAGGERGDQEPVEPVGEAQR